MFKKFLEKRQTKQLDALIELYVKESVLITQMYGRAFWGKVDYNATPQRIAEQVLWYYRNGLRNYYRDSGFYEKPLKALRSTMKDHLKQEAQAQAREDFTTDRLSKYSTSIIEGKQKELLARIQTMDNDTRDEFAIKIGAARSTDQLAIIESFIDDTLQKEIANGVARDVSSTEVIFEKLEEKAQGFLNTVPTVMVDSEQSV